ncbi:MAG TPA: extensin family protein [Xanthobacteraceae bacterium]|nr:extensin family protein [Xanthobacteraceae bacterium]
MAPSACFLALTLGLAEAQALPPIVEANGCEAPDVVRLEAVLLKDRRRIAVSPPAVLRCSMATSVANWVREDLQSAVAALGAQLGGLDNFDSFECRGRNRIAGARISEHGRANALDIRALLLAGGRKLELTNPEVPRQFREALRVSACNRFTTVLGPGSDGYHEDHVHIDLSERRNGYRICQWDVRDAVMPLPRERPPEADVAEAKPR